MRNQEKAQSTLIDPGTVQAYRETDYVVHTEAPVTLKVDVASPGLLAMYKGRRVNSCMFITAWNPESRQRPDDHLGSAFAVRRGLSEVSATHLSLGANQP